MNIRHYFREVIFFLLPLNNNIGNIGEGTWIARGPKIWITFFSSLDLMLHYCEQTAVTFQRFSDGVQYFRGVGIAVPIPRFENNTRILAEGDIFSHMILNIK